MLLPSYKAALMRWSSLCPSPNVRSAHCSLLCTACEVQIAHNPIYTVLKFLISPGFSESLKDSKSILSQSTFGLALDRGFGSQSTLSGTEYRPAVEEVEEAITLSNMATPKQGKRLHIPVVRIHDAQVRTSTQANNGCR